MAYSFEKMVTRLVLQSREKLMNPVRMSSMNNRIEILMKDGNTSDSFSRIKINNDIEYVKYDERSIISSNY